jgi:hypothetical protein
MLLKNVQTAAHGGGDVSFACFNFPKIAWQKYIFFYQLWNLLGG